MATQSTYQETIDAGRAGAIVNSEPNTLISRTIETAAGIGFGLPVAQGAADGGIIAVQAGVTEILGIAVRERSVRPETPNKFAQYEDVRVMTKGLIWVTAGVTLVPGDPVWVTVATGVFNKTDGGSGTSVLIPNARYDSSATSGNLVALRLA